MSFLQNIMVSGMFLGLLWVQALLAQTQTQAQTSQLGGIFSVALQDAKGGKMDMQQYQGKTVLIANIATRCGYTPQLKGLEALHTKYADRGLVVLGVPSNDFGGQTPEPNKEVLEFCQSNFGVSFPVLEKVVVKGEGKHELFKNLLSQTADQAEIKWNFEKFLVGPDGRLIQRFLSAVEPESPEMIEAIEATLNRK